MSAPLTRRRSRAAALLVAAVWLCVSVRPGVRAQSPTPPTFASQIAALSEGGGYFDTDNLISNERSYLHVIPELVLQHVHGGAYVGVGPDQNFSYITAVRPSVAFLVDIRRDNLLLHLLFKSLFELSRTRVDYLALLSGRASPEPIAGWDAKPIDAIVGYVDKAQPLVAKDVDALRARVTEKIKTFGVPLSTEDLATIDRFHREFINAGLLLRFQSTGRAPQYYYPTYRDLLMETDKAGTRRSFMASEDDFQYLKTLQAKDMVIPVVGDLSGPAALVAIGAWLDARHEVMTTFYASNVEFYLFRDGTFARFIGNLGKMPHTANAVIIRSFFSGYGQPLPGYGSASATQGIQGLLDGFAHGQFQRYADLAAWSK